MNQKLNERTLGFGEGVIEAGKQLRPIIEQLCRDLNEAHNEILRQQGVPESDYGKFDWPEWSPQANSIRWAERVLQKRFAKTNNWTLFPEWTS